MNIKTFIIDPNVKYLEMICDGAIINKYYELKNPGKYYYTIPDACIDLQFIWKNGQVDAYACGTHLEGVFGLKEKNDLCFGVKFQPGIIPAMIGRQVKQLVCSRMKIADHPQITELTGALGRTSSFEERIELFEELFPYNGLMEKTDSKVKYILDKINRFRGCINISELVSEMGYNQRYMDRVFHDEIGMDRQRDGYYYGETRGVLLLGYRWKKMAGYPYQWGNLQFRTS